MLFQVQRLHRLHLLLILKVVNVQKDFGPRLVFRIAIFVGAALSLRFCATIQHNCRPEIEVHQKLRADIVKHRTKTKTAAGLAVKCQGINNGLD